METYTDDIHDEGIISTLASIKKLAVTPDREIVYNRLLQKYADYWVKYTQVIHTACTDDTSSYDVLDTCQCHYQIYRLRTQLEDECRSIYTLYKLTDPLDTVYEEHIEEEPTKTRHSRFRRFITCFVTCRMSAREP